MKAHRTTSCRQWSQTTGMRGYFLATLTGLTFWSQGAAGAISEDTHGGLTRRNAFGPGAPVPATNVQPQDGWLPNIELKGITTILGRPQALLAISGTLDSPEASGCKSVIMEAGQIAEGIKIDEINYDAGIVRLEIKGVEKSLRLLGYAPNPIEEPALSTTGNQPSIANRPINRGSDAIAPALPEASHS